MNPESKRFLNDLSRAAELRANGIGWNAIARTLGHPAETCQSWPKRYPLAWARLLDEDMREMMCQARREAIQALQRLLRSENPRIVLSAAGGRVRRPAPRSWP